MIKTQTPQLSAKHGILQKASIRTEILLGQDMAADPENAQLPDLVIRTTTVYSPWYACSCRVCKDKFREGDRVRLCPVCGEPFHDDSQYTLHCWHKNFTGERICTEESQVRFGDTERVIARCGYKWNGIVPDEINNGGTPQNAISSVLLVTEFVRGIEQVWRPFGKQKSIKVETGSPLIGRNCPWCRFKVRVGDWVVECPCNSGCGTYFHQDVFRHLTCWNEWNGVEGHNYCPNTGAPYKEVSDSENEVNHAR